MKLYIYFILTIINNYKYIILLNNFFNIPIISILEIVDFSLIVNIF